MIWESAFTVEQDGEAVVGGCVVDKDQLEIPKSLMYQIPETGGESFLEYVLCYRQGR